MQEQVKAVQHMQDFIAEHLFEELSFSDVAKSSLYSPWYARRLFIEYLGVTPAEYIRKFKLSTSALQLRDNKCKILDVAMDAAFGSVEWDNKNPKIQLEPRGERGYIELLAVK